MSSGCPGNVARVNRVCCAAAVCRLGLEPTPRRSLLDCRLLATVASSASSSGLPALVSRSNRPGPRLSIAGGIGATAPGASL